MKRMTRPNGIRALLAVVACLSARVAFPATGAPVAPAESASPAPCAVVLENFEGYGNDSFPEKWRAMKKDARTIYRIEAENGNRFLRASADKKTIQIGLEHPFDPKQHTHLAWRWRAREFPAGAGEKDRWFDEKINFYDDYRKFFGAEPGKVQGIAILSSSEVTKSLSVADYDDFVLLP